jgi:hypothetical protein
MLPTCGLIDQVTAVFEVPVTVAVKVALWPPFKEALPGDNATPVVDVTTFDPGAGVEGLSSGFKVSETAADLVGSATLVAVITTTCCPLIELGAV